MSDSKGRVAPDQVERIGVVGAGTIGASWASYFLARGYQVTVYDPSPTYETYVRDYVENAWPSLKELGVMTDDADPDQVAFTQDLAAAVKDVQFIQESVPERIDIKHDVYDQIESAYDPEAVIASSASGLMPSELQKQAKYPARFVLAHPFNPPHLIPLVEVIGGEQTDPSAVNWTVDFYNGCAKQAIRLNKEVPGHVANRLQAAIWREAIHLVAEGVASVSDVDRAVAYGPGLRWAIFGPHLTFHLGGGGYGLDVFIERYRDSFHRWWDDLGNPELTEQVGQLLAAGIEEQEEGRSFEELAAERDRKLVAMLRAFNQADSSE
ncbi:MAG: 3-hydroxyacyl-CoA dehydrogenase NAD-binding domain-containing protein [Chloroflexota bacterium]